MTMPTSPTNTTALAVLPFALPDQTLISKGSERGMLQPLHLEEVRDELRQLIRLQDPEDHLRTLDQLHVDFSKGYMTAVWLGPEGPEERKYLVTSTASHQLAGMILPSRFFTGLKNLAALDEQGAKLASMCWAKFARQCAEEPRLVRCVRMRYQGRIHEVIRSTHSTGYAPYANLEYVEDILTNAKNKAGEKGLDFAELPVLQTLVTDNGMRLRFAALDGGLSAFKHIDPDVLLAEPIPMIEAWNSETGCRRTGLRGGLWKLSNTMGLGHWDRKAEYAWTHRGTTARIRAQVKDAFQNMFTVAAGVVEAYKDAVDIAIDNAFAWMEQELRGEVPERIIKTAGSALLGDLVTPGGCLASVVDAVALAAQEETDLFEQDGVMQLASTLLQKGRAIAVKNNGSIEAE